jgi:hypothetical protein
MCGEQVIEEPLHIDAFREEARRSCLLDRMTILGSRLHGQSENFDRWKFVS